MADSAITYTGIDEEFPVPGQDNDSQGFRDNFSQIKTALETANGELTDLLTAVARTDGLNNFNGNTIQNANLLQKINVNSALTLTFTNFPTGGAKYASTRLILKGIGSGPHTVNFETGGNGDLYFNNKAAAVDGNGNFTLSDSDQPKVIDVWSDNGLDIYIDYIGQFELQA